MTKSILIENIETAELDELLAAQKAIGQTIRVRQEAFQTERAKELQSLAQRYGLKVRISSPSAHEHKQPPKYRHPENPNLTWCGRGMRPHWLKELEQRGGNRKDLLIIGGSE